MTREVLDLQRTGHALALAHPEVLAAVKRTRTGRIAIAYIEWSDYGGASMIVPWQVVATQRDAELASAIISDHHSPGSATGHTSINWAITYASKALGECPFPSEKHVVDISVNGPNNDGPSPELARDSAVGNGYVVNAIALPSSVAETSTELGMSLDPNEGAWRDPTGYLRARVIGGDSSFAVAATSAENYIVALRRKIILEIADAGEMGVDAADGTNSPIWN